MNAVQSVHFLFGKTKPLSRERDIQLVLCGPEGWIRKYRTLIEKLCFSSSGCPKIDLPWSEVSTSRNREIWRCRELNVSQLWGRTTPVQSPAQPPTIWEVWGQITKSGCARLCVYKVGMLSLMLRCSYFNISKSGCWSQSLSARW